MDVNRSSLKFSVESSQIQFGYMRYFRRVTKMQKFRLIVVIAVLLMSMMGVMAQDQNIVETAAGSEDFSTLVSLVESAGLAETLSGEGPFTVFAPTNEAFAALPADVVEF